MFNYFIDQIQFFNNLDYSKYKNFKYNLCWLTNIYIILKNLWFNMSENDILKKSIELNAYDDKYWWKYKELIWLLKIYWINAKIFKSKICHNYILKNKLKKITDRKYIYIASVKYINNENHLIIIDNFLDDIIFYKSVWTKNSNPIENWKINYNKFINIYNKRWIIIYLK